jgi:hypothetical protein
MDDIGSIHDTSRQHLGASYDLEAIEVREGNRSVSIEHWLGENGDTTKQRYKPNDEHDQLLVAEALTTADVECVSKETECHQTTPDDDEGD